MKLQQVNLYQSELKDIKLKYSAFNVLQLSFILFVILLAAYGFKYFQLQQHQATLALANETQEKLNAEKAKVGSSKENKDSALEKEIVAKNKELDKKRKVLKVLSQDEFGNADGFAAHIAGLARQRIEGLWLTKLRLSNGGTSISMQGSTTKSVFLPQYLQRLSAEKAFSGATFEHFEISKDEKKKNWFNFNLNTNQSSKAK